jgi:hypothetical protein
MVASKKKDLPLANVGYDVGNPQHRAITKEAGHD